MSRQTIFHRKLLALCRILYHNSSNSIEANDSPHQLWKTLSGSSFIRELVPFCPCSVYPDPNRVIFMKQWQSSQTDTILPRSLHKDGP
ncbi:hypothetical protein CEXT_458331 [Caerostris extrusa]|uniref:Uncharacterized protein n=1 Tax=Caerostris extrusa TaxID=172846 RepID=A0AAV4T0A3_CAEEX|nr:hypothetical protein CEXT_458331 [Caerostris extrusa]